MQEYAMPEGDVLTKAKKEVEDCANSLSEDSMQ